MGAHVARPARKISSSLDHVFVFVFFMLSLVAVSTGSSSSSLSDSDALLRFKSSLGNNVSFSSWDISKKPCDWNIVNWIGVLCLNNSIWGLQLENMGLTGTIDVDALVSVESIRTISLMNNRFEGPLPEFRKLGKLKALYLSNNRFVGEIPDTSLQGMNSLKRLYLANNEFTGSIPSSLTTLPKLTELRLEGNQFTGKIPDFQQQGLRSVNLASNQLEGPIPASLRNMNPNSFSGNKNLCGPPLSSCPAFPAEVKKSNSNTWKIVLIVIIVGVVLVALSVALFLFYKKKNESDLKSSSSSVVAATYSSEQVQDEAQPPRATTGLTRRADQAKLSFLRDDIEKFDLQDLLRASAEVLGSGTFGASYKAGVSGQVVVVKRYRHMNTVGREEFYEHMRRLGRLKHPNLLPLTGYYYRKEEKLLVMEFVDNGSLASHLHGNHSLEEQGLDWQTRLKIVKGVAKGMAYLYNELPMMVPHGHLKSSNVLLDDSMEPLLTDYALRPVINPESAHTLMVAYKSPEYTLHGRTTNKTDIWCLGILILEILTGKFPENYLIQGYDKNANLATWVNKMAEEKRIGEVFDKDMTGTKNSKRQMINVLKIGLNCCEEDSDMRMDIKVIVEKIERLTEGDTDEDSFGSEHNTFSVRGNEDEFSFNLDR